MRDDEPQTLEPGAGPAAHPAHSPAHRPARGPGTDLGLDAGADTCLDVGADAGVDTGLGGGLDGGADTDLGVEPGAAPGPAPWVRRLVVLALVLAAVNLRPAITSLGALLKEVRDGLGMSGTMAGLLTSVPVACFALFGFAAPRLARRFGPGAVVCAGMAAITGGLALRPLGGSVPVFLAASALALAGIAVSNVLLPVIVKRYFPDRVGTITGVYSMALSLGTALAAAVTVPLTDAMGGNWRLGLGMWALLAAAAVAPWLPLVRDRSAAAPPRTPAAPATATAPVPARQPAPAQAPAGASAKAPHQAPATGGQGRITRSRTAWMVACFFGLQSTAAYVTMGWLPQILRDSGTSADQAGLLLAVTMAMSVPLSFVLPPLAARMRSQGPIVLVLAAFQVGGFTGLLAAPTAAPWVWALMLGMANCAFPLVLTMIGMRSRTGHGVVRLSAFAQSTGYLMSIPGPILVGTLNQVSGGWSLPLALMIALAVPQAVCGVAAGRSRHVEDEL